MLLPAAGLAKEAREPAVSGQVKIIGYGAFVPAKFGKDGERAQARLTRRTDSLPAEGGTAFGLLFVLDKTPDNAPALLEVRVTPPPSGASGAPALPRKWFVPVRPGEEASAVYSPAYDWEVRPGQWRMELYDGDRRVAEKTFRLVPVSERSAAARQKHGASRPKASSENAPAPQNKTKPSAAKPAAAKAEKKSVRAVAAGQGVGSAVHVLQTGVFSVRANAEKQAAALRGKGKKACILRSGRGENVRYRVLTGRFTDRTSAAKALSRFKKAENMDAVAKSFPAGELDAAGCP